MRALSAKTGLPISSVLILTEMAVTCRMSGLEELIPKRLPWQAMQRCIGTHQDRLDH